MARFVAGDDRSQSTLFPERLVEYLGENNPVRAIDVFVDELDLAKLGFGGIEPEATGRPAYHPADEQGPLVLYPALSLVSINPSCSHNHPARDARALAQGRLSPLLALEVALSGRAAADRDGPARIDPADERRKSALGRATHSRRTPQARV